jgi:hypothetical protein
MYTGLMAWPCIDVPTGNIFQRHVARVLVHAVDGALKLPGPVQRAPARLLAVANPRSFWGTSQQNLSTSWIANGPRLNFHPRPKVKPHDHLHGDSKTKGRLIKRKVWHKQDMARTRHGKSKTLHN